MKLLPSFSIFMLFILAAPIMKAQEIFLPGSRSQALAGVSASLSDCWSAFGNQAGLVQVDRFTIGGSFQNRFLVKELSTSSGLLALPVLSSVVAFSVYQFGKTTFQQEKFGLAFARKLNPRLGFGIQFNYYRFFLAEDNQSIGSYGVELGVQYQLTHQLLLGFHILNPYKINIETFSGEYSYPSRLNIGASFQLSESFVFISELQKDLLYLVNIKTGLEYIILKKLFIRIGISGKPYELSAGLGFVVQKLKIDMAVAYNQYLGNSPSLSFQYHL